MEHTAPTTWLLKLPFLPTDESLKHVNGAVVVFGVITVLSIIANIAIRKKTETLIIPEKKFSVFTFFDVLIEALHGMVIGIIGHHGESQFPFIATFFIFVWFSNLLGLFPLSDSPSTNFNTTLALGLASYLYFNFHGMKAHGVVGYFKHFLFGMGFFGLPIAILELFSHALRPLTLALRLLLNMNVDHILVGIFGDIFKWILPVPFLLFGIIVSTIQAFIFTTLSTVYVGMATEHEEEH